MGSHNPPPLGASVLAGTRSSLQSMWDLTIHPPSEPSVFVGTLPSVHPLGAQRPRWHTARCLVLIPHNSSPPLADIVLFEVLFWASPQNF